MKVRIRRAKSKEARALTELAHASKRHWGYPESWIRLWGAELTFTPEYVRKHDVYCATIEGRIVGFYALGEPHARRELDALWIEPRLIGHGIGKQLFDHALGRARNGGATHLTMISDPNAEGFYRKMGARRIGMVDSVPEGRTIPELELDLARATPEPPPDPGERD